MLSDIYIMNRISLVLVCTVHYPYVMLLTWGHFHTIALIYLSKSDWSGQTQGP